MKRRMDIAQRAALRADLPGEPLMKAPLVEILGNSRVLVEYHRGITCYNSCEITVCTRCGEISVHGDTMEIVSMTKQQLVIVGDIHAVLLNGGK